MGILTVLFNRQIMQYLGTDALAVYGPIVNVSTFVQCCAYSVGQAAQPLISVNFGAGAAAASGKPCGTRFAPPPCSACSGRRSACSARTCTSISSSKPTAAILEIAPAIIRCYSLSFILLPLNIFSTYYFQALIRPEGRLRGIGPARLCVDQRDFDSAASAAGGRGAVWLAMPITEALVAVYAVWMIARYTKALPVEKAAA